MTAVAVIALSVVYGVVGLVVACRVVTLLAWYWLAENNRTYRQQHPVPETAQWFGAGAVGLCCAAIWPVVLVAAALRGVLFAPPRDVQVKRQAERIAELESELEIGRNG
jgi:ABC-type xylose transport system permease subunit